MPSVRRIILRHVMSGICSKMNRTKRLDGDMMETPLKRCLSTFDMTLLGVGHMVGAGIYVLTGSVAHSIAGPGVIISFMLAGLASLLAAVCYAELGSRVPKAGSAYVYTYVTMGEFWAFIIGWNIMLEHVMGAASVARAWSGYVDSLTGGPFKNMTQSLMYLITGNDMNESTLNFSPDPVAGVICILYALLLGCGVKVSVRLNSIFTLVNLGVIILVIGVGSQFVDLKNWFDESHGGFLPFGFQGVLTGAASCFYAFVGFDSIASCGEEAKNPSRSIPLATIFSMAIVTVGYVLISGVVTLIVPYWQIDPRAALPEIFDSVNITWAKYVITIGALCGMTTTLFGSIFAIPRIMYAMACDGLLSPHFAKVNQQIQLPMFNIVISAILCASTAFFFDLQHLVEFMSIGTFSAYLIVSASVIILRYRPDNQLSPTLPTNTKKNHSLESPMSDSSSPTSIADSSSPDDSESLINDQINKAGHLKARYSKLARYFGNWEPGMAVTIAVIIFTGACIAQSIINFYLFIEPISWANILLNVHFILIMVICLLVISAHEQNPPVDDKCRVPMVPLIPALSIYFNIILMGHLQIVTWYRFYSGMFIGICIYFLYGIHHSKEASGANSYSVLMTKMELEQVQSRMKLNLKTKQIPSYSKKDSDQLPILTN
ncbi:cationic amino acid transporter 4 [Chelonus insularis]|uniref:cationic amino acid transporter 4 n=1 Tax=Chelonus insularis TaxID=460826 RepID=UPI00158BED27|nr:cationic amino acid transporter 4 [Chelonus insularis]XP_034950559.1 cationic amino acid transporter 4 [Chelonus insularis]